MPVSRSLLVLAAVVPALAGCGGPEPAPRALAPVRLTVDAPPDPSVVDDPTVEVHGRVWPETATVLVAGDEAGVDRGGFSAVIDLHEGANVIDITAGAPRRAAAMTAVRVTRRIRVAVPSLAGRSADDAVARLRAAGLKAQLEKGGGFLDDLLPGDPGVCDTSPPAGTRVAPGTVVRVQVAKSC
jgi:hypothetical protein